MSSLIPTLLFSLLILTQLSLAADQNQDQHQSPKCYALNGTPLDSTYAPCGPSSSTQHSSCCALHKTSGSPDICLTNGLCMSTESLTIGTIWQSGCTDPTGRSPSCSKLCPSAKSAFNTPHNVPAWNLQQCSYGTYCCREAGDQRSCCSNSTAPTVTTSSLAAFLSQPTSIPSPAPAPEAQSPQPSPACSHPRTPVIVAILGAVLGSLVLALLGLLAWMYKKEKRQRRLKEHYEEQFGQNFAYRRTVVVGAASDDEDSKSVLDVRSVLDSKSVLDAKSILDVRSVREVPEERK